MDQNPVIQKEHIKEIIEKSGNSDMEGILKDIFYAIKDLNVKEEYKPILIDN